MYKLEHHVGRLVEVWRGAVSTSDEYKAFVAELHQLYARLGRPLVIASDCRSMVHLPPSMAITIGKGMRAANDIVERSAILLPPQQTSLGAHLDRLIDESAHSSRRVFFDLDELKRWLGEVLDDDERRRLDVALQKT